MYRPGEDSPTIYWQYVANEFNKITGKHYTSLNCREYAADSYKPCPRCSRVPLNEAIKIVNKQRLKKGLPMFGQEGYLI